MQEMAKTAQTDVLYMHIAGRAILFNIQAADRRGELVTQLTLMTFSWLL
jgi:hypothetical protein